MTNTSATENGLPICEGSTTICHDSLSSFLSLLFLSAPVNMIHLAILFGMTSFRGGKPHLILLQYMTLTDIVWSLANFVANLCVVRRTILNTSGRLGVMFYTTLDFSLTYMRYNILALAMYEKFLAICKPFLYEVSFVVKRVHTTVATVFVWSIGLAIALSLVGAKTLCLHEVLGVTTHHVGCTTCLMISIVFCIICGIILVFFIVSIMMELISMSKRSADTADPLLVTAGAYVVIVGTYFLVTIVPAVANLIIMVVQHKEIISLDIMTAWMMLVYAYANTFVYAFMSSAFREQAKTLLGKICRRVKPARSVSVQQEAEPDNA